jgi:hypothetical protein
MVTAVGMVNNCVIGIYFRAENIEVQIKLEFFDLI